MRPPSPGYRLLVLGALAFLSSCAAEVRGLRVQKPFTVAPPGTEVSLVSIEVPAWVAKPERQEALRALVKAGLAKAFAKTSFVMVDETSVGERILIGPHTAPVIFDTAYDEAEVGVPWPVTAFATGSPPISWQVRSGPPGMTIDAPTGKIQWTPTETGKVKVVLAASNSHGGEAKWAFTVEVVNEVKVKVETEAVQPATEPGTGRKPLTSGTSAPAPRPLAVPELAPRPGMLLVDPEVAFVAILPRSLPGTGPLVMGVQVFEISESSHPVVLNRDTMATMIRPTLITDLVYTLWTREGREVETRRIQLTGAPNTAFRRRLKIIPERVPVLRWDDDAQERQRYASRDPEHLLADTLDANAAAFLFPYGERAIWFTARLDESSSELKPGLALSAKGEFDAAYQAFEAVSAAMPTLAGAFFNMGVMRELQGRDEEALALYERAVGLATVDLPVPELCTLQQSKLLERMKSRVALPLK